jgi:acyl-CoA synthetase (NDP forming)
MFDVASLLNRQPLPTGNRVAILTNAGGPGVLCADALAAAGCDVPTFSLPLQEELRRFAPRHSTVSNPIDLVATVDPQLIRHCFECLLESDEIDAVVLMYVPRLPGTSLNIARAIQDIGPAKSKKTQLAVVFAPEQEVALVQQVIEPIPCFMYPESAAGALAVAVDHAARQAVPDVPSTSADHRDSSDIRASSEQLLKDCDEAGRWLRADETQRLLTDAGFSVPAWQVADSQQAVVDAAQRIGFPVVLKTAVPHILHKSSVGGVVLDVRNSAETRDAWRTLDARFRGLAAVLVQRYQPAEVEAMIGVKRELGFGHAIGLGAGGTSVERRREIEFRLAPLTSREAYQLVRDSPISDLCAAADGQLTAAGRAVHHALLHVSALISAIPEICELDLNPVALSRTSGSLQVLDARVYVQRSSNWLPVHQATPLNTRDPMRAEAL